jgi:hypothetical protein
MAKKPSIRKSVEQLKSMVWPTQEAAIADIKASRITLGDDSELREYKPGSWQILPVGAAEDDYSPRPPDEETATAKDRESVVIDSLRKKPGAEPRGTPKVIAHAKKPPIKVNGKRDPRPAAKKAAAPMPKKAAAKQPKPQPGVVAIAPKAMEAAASVAGSTPPPRPAIEGVPENRPDPLPNEGRPYVASIVEGSGSFPNHSAHTFAIDLSRKTGSVVLIRDKDGLLVRTYDWAKMKPAPGAKKAARKGLPSVGRKPSGESQFARAIRLLERKEGATAAQLEKEIGWVSVTQRYANRAAVMSGSTVEVLGEKHWRLKKRS